MLWLYMDDSNEHDPATQAVRRLMLAGAMTTLEAWECLSMEWRGHLDSFGVKWFHMTDFEARRGVYDLPNEKRRELLGGLLEIIKRHVMACFGTVDDPTLEPRWLRYGGHILKTQNELTDWGRKLGVPIRLVLAKQPDVPLSNLVAYVERWQQPDLFTLEGFADARTVCPVQVADIVAYEFSRAMRTVKP